MPWLNSVREKHIKKGVFCILTVIFLLLNRGHTLNSLNHIFLTMRAQSNYRLAEELADTIHSTALDLGETFSLLFALSIIWLLFVHILKRLHFDYKYRYIDKDKQLKKITLLTDQLQAIKEPSLEGLATINKLIEQIPDLRRSIDKVAELNVRVDDLFEKKKKKPSLQQSRPPKQEEDLFTEKRHPKKRSLRKRKKSDPKF